MDGGDHRLVGLRQRIILRGNGDGAGGAVWCQISDRRGRLIIMVRDRRAGIRDRHVDRLVGTAFSCDGEGARIGPGLAGRVVGCRQGYFRRFVVSQMDRSGVRSSYGVGRVARDGDYRRFRDFSDRVVDRVNMYRNRGGVCRDDHGGRNGAIIDSRRGRSARRQINRQRRGGRHSTADRQYADIAHRPFAGGTISDLHAYRFGSVVGGGRTDQQGNAEPRRWR